MEKSMCMRISESLDMREKNPANIPFYVSDIIEEVISLVWILYVLPNVWLEIILLTYNLFMTVLKYITLKTLSVLSQIKATGRPEAHLKIGVRKRP